LEKILVTVKLPDTTRDFANSLSDRLRHSQQDIFFLGLKALEALADDRIINYKTLLTGNNGTPPPEDAAAPGENKGAA